LEVKVNKRFLKDLAAIPARERTRIEQFIFEDLEHFNTIEEVGRLEKLSGYEKYYRARFGNYRLGVSYLQGTLTIERVLHRKEMYRYFP
jgi:mRNA interferase RelE/StbE